MADMLDKLKAIAEERKQREANRGQAKSTFLKLPQEGETQVRFLPAKKDGEVFFKEFGEHWIDRQRVYCPEVTKGDRCPICEAVNELRNRGDDESKELAGQFRVKKQHYANVIVRGEEEDGPKIYKFGIKLANRIVDDCVDEGVDISHPTDGNDYRIIKQKVDGFPNYDRSRTAKQQTPAADDSAQFDAWMADARDVHAMVDDAVQSYDEISELFSGTAGSDVEDSTAGVQTSSFDPDKFLKEVNTAVS